MKKRNQHYVPKFYLRNFSNDEKNISLYNFKNKKVIKLATIKSQASSNYFYGEDEFLEDFFSKIEGTSANHIKEIIINRILPSQSSMSYYHLLLFMITMDLRTPQAIEEAHEHLNKALELFSQFDERLSLFKDGKYRIELTEPVTSLLGTLEKNFHYVTDLKVKVIVNNTSIPFITSDAPIAKYNEYMEERGYEYGFDGFGCKGLQIFLPITSNLLLLFYDGWVCRVSDKKAEFVETKNLNDIRKINLLQAIYSREQIFFKELAEEEIEKTVSESLKYRKLKSIKYNHVRDHLEKDGKLSKQFSFGHKPINISPNFTFTRITKNAKKYKFNDYVIQLRDESKRFS